MSIVESKLLFLGLILLLGCRSGFKKGMSTKEIGKYKYSLAQTNQSSPEQLKFVFRIEHESGENVINSYVNGCLLNTQQRVNYLNFDIIKDVFLVTENGDSIKANLAIYPNAPTVSKYCDVIIGFKRPENANDLTFIWRDNLLCTGTIKMSLTI